MDSAPGRMAHGAASCHATSRHSTSQSASWKPPTRSSRPRAEAASGPGPGRTHDSVRGIAIARLVRRPTRKQSRGSCHDATTGLIEMSPYVARNIWRPMLRPKLCYVWVLERYGGPAACVLSAPFGEGGGCRSRRRERNISRAGLPSRLSRCGPPRVRSTRRTCKPTPARNSMNACSNALSRRSAKPGGAITSRPARAPREPSTLPTYVAAPSSIPCTGNAHSTEGNIVRSAT